MPNFKKLVATISTIHFIFRNLLLHTSDDFIYCLFTLKNQKMSGWSAYIQTLTDSYGGIKRAAIIGYPDGSVWARTENQNEFKVKS